MTLNEWILIGLACLMTAHCCQAEARDKETFQKIYKEVVRASKKYEIPKNIILAVIAVESGFDPEAVGSSHNEVGLLQIYSKWHDCASFDIDKNIDCGTAYLASLIKCRESKEINLLNIYKYNTGPGYTSTSPNAHPYVVKFNKELKAKRWTKWMK